MARLPAQRNVVLNRTHAHCILTFVFGSRVRIRAPDLTDDDIKFSQALMAEMLSRSFQMRVVEAANEAVAPIPSGVASTIIKFLKGAAKNTVRYWDRERLAHMINQPVIYLSVQRTIGRNFQSQWTLRTATTSEGGNVRGLTPRGG